MVIDAKGYFTLVIGATTELVKDKGLLIILHAAKWLLDNQTKGRTLLNGYSLRTVHEYPVSTKQAKLQDST